MVEWKELGSISEIGTGSNNREDSSENGLYPFFVRSKDILKIDNYLFDEEAILIPGEGGIGDIFHYINGKYGLHQRTYRVHPNSSSINGKYLYYYLFENFKTYINKKSFKSTATSIRKPMLTEFPVAIPPLSEQNRIVGILDIFTSSINNLDKQIELRQKQYEYYRNKLLSFEEGDAKWVIISDLADNYTGLTYKPANVSETGTLVLRSSNIQDSHLVFEDNVYVQGIQIPQRALVKQDDVLICVRNGSRALIGKCAMIDKASEGMAFGAFMSILRAKDVNPKYLYYVWQLDSTVKQYKGDDAAPINQITSKDFSRIKVQVPSLDKQRTIVRTLDTFESLLSNLKKERELRQKQYEYYREKLLTFA